MSIAGEVDPDVVDVDAAFFFFCVNQLRVTTTKNTINIVDELIQSDSSSALPMKRPRIPLSDWVTD